MNVAIKVPNDVRGKVMSFPFIHKLVKEINKQLKDDEESEDVLNLHLISSDNGIDVLNLLPFEAFYHEIESSELKTIFTVHRACMGLQLENVDLYISVTDSFVDASIGKNIKAKISAGFSGGKNNFLLNKKIPKPSGVHEATKIFQLLKVVKDGELSEIPSVAARELTPSLGSWSDEPYITINLSLKDNEIHPEWKELIDLLESQKIVLICDQLDKDIQKSKIDDYVKTLSDKNTYITYEFTGYINFAKLISYSWCLISEDSDLVYVASYCATNIFHLSRKNYSKLFDSRYFFSNHRVYGLNNSEFTSGSDFNYGKVFDEVISYIDIKTKEFKS